MLAPGIPAAEGSDKLAAQAMAKFQGANKLGIRSCALACIGIRVVGTEVLNADNANACIARRGQNLIDGAVAQVRVEVRTRRHHHAFVTGLRGKGELLRRVRRDDGELGIGRICRHTRLPCRLSALPVSEQPLFPPCPAPPRMCRPPSKNLADSKTSRCSPYRSSYLAQQIHDLFSRMLLALCQFSPFCPVSLMRTGTKGAGHRCSGGELSEWARTGCVHHILIPPFSWSEQNHISSAVAERCFRLARQPVDEIPDCRNRASSGPYFIPPQSTRSRPFRGVNAPSVLQL